MAGGRRVQGPRPLTVAGTLAVLVVGAPAEIAGQAGVTGQAGVVSGRVVRADGPIGLADAELVLSPSGATTRTDARGHFEFREVAPGRVEVVASRPGFVSASVTLRVGALAANHVDIPLEPVAAILDPIVTTVTWGDPRSLGRVAGAVSVTDSSALLRDRTVGLHEPLRTMPGVQVASRYGTDDVNLGIRGSAARGRQAVRGVAVLLDGVPLTEPDGAVRPDLIELAAARQVEVVRGPASALYAGSAGGVVNVVSRTGRDSPGLTVRAQGGGFGLRKYDARAGGKFAGERGSGLVAASYTSTEGYRAHSEADILRGHMALDYLAGPGTRLFFQATGSSLDSRLPGSLSQPEFDAAPDAAAPAAVAFGFGRLDDRYRVGGRVETTVGVTDASGYFFYGGRTLFFPIPSEIVDADFHRVQGGGRLRPGRVAGLPLEVTIGFDYDRIFGTDNRWENDAGARGALRDAGRDSGAGLGTYGEVEWQASASVSATLGLRYDRVTYRFESEAPGAIPRQETTFDQASPRLAAVWRPDPVSSVYATVGRGFEVPAFGELSLSPGDPIRTVRPKSLWNYEVGARRIAGDRWLVEGAAFLAAVRGEFVPVAVDGRDLPENAARSRNVGLELGVTALATPWLDLGASYTFLDLRLRDYTSFVLDSAGMREEVDFSGNRLPGVPGHRVTGEARTRPLNRLDLGVQVEWQGVVYVETGNADQDIWYYRLQPDGPVQQVPFRAVPARALVHLNAAFRLGPATVFGRVENLFGARYVGNVRANEIFGRFYEAGSPAWVSVGLGLSGGRAAPAGRP